MANKQKIVYEATTAVYGADGQPTIHPGTRVDEKDQAYKDNPGSFRAVVVDDTDGEHVPGGAKTEPVSDTPEGQEVPPVGAPDAEHGTAGAGLPDPTGKGEGVPGGAKGAGGKK